MVTTGEQLPYQGQILVSNSPVSNSPVSNSPVSNCPTSQIISSPPSDYAHPHSKRTYTMNQLTWLPP